ncbi:helix-hairpin-helix domain-containing protein [candidate division KSB1 bacterium]|nr:helix-hairpin-helix domain-containing protein [candidate division KSB1 bacterium]RQW00669.1 MAG: helix-hairpin-helix domain-containing protein [candidate division KSB1 bacterium]
MSIFTKQEQRFLLFLVITFIVGFCLKIVRNSLDKKPDETWERERQRILADFEKKSQRLDDGDKNRIAAETESNITKKTLTEKIDINKATREELEILPGIGPVIAEKITSFRQDNGPFKTIQDIQKVKNIGPKTFEKIKDYITVE